MIKKKPKSQQQRTPKDTLVIIGNGFDRWQGLNTSYYNFRDYYLAHRDEILRKLRIRKKVIRNEDGSCIGISDVELIYGDPFQPKELDDGFWGTFETSLDKIDAERINLFFGKDRKGLREMKKSVQNANRILREAFCRWIATITIEEMDTGYQFGDNCLFINFNYTDTLLKRFGVRAEDELHIHGEANDKESIVVGHANHPQLPEEMLYRMGGRFRGLFFVEQILYETDKHVQDNIRLLCMFLAIKGTMPTDIKHVYVLGHSMSLPDIEYFAFLADATCTRDENDAQEQDNEIHSDIDPLEALHLRMQYAIQHGGYGLQNEQIDPAQQEAIARQFEQELAERSQVLENDFYKMIKKALKQNEYGSASNAISVPRTEDAMWHISCHSDKDKCWAEAVMKELGCSRYQLYDTIDECLEPFMAL